MMQIHVCLIPLFQAIMLGLGLQCKTVDNLASELELPASQLLGLFNRTIRRCVQYLTGILEHSIKQGLVLSRTDVMFSPIAKSMRDELDEAAKVNGRTLALCYVLVHGWRVMYVGVLYYRN
jgi:N-acetyltransferase 10